jgi:hypothetical protein
MATATTTNTTIADEDEWGGWEEEDQRTRCLFVEAIEQSVGAAIQRDKRETDFDLPAVRRHKKLGIYKTIRLINFIRSKVCLLLGIGHVDARDRGINIDGWGCR